VTYAPRRLAYPGSQELPDLAGGLACLGGAEQELIDVGQALADFHSDIDPRLRLLLQRPFF
jgi:hypothetical protein